MAEAFRGFLRGFPGGCAISAKRDEGTNSAYGAREFSVGKDVGGGGPTGERDARTLRAKSHDAFRQARKGATPAAAVQVMPGFKTDQ